MRRREARDKVFRLTPKGVMQGCTFSVPKRETDEELVCMSL
jgi:hypothetical protein